MSIESGNNYKITNAKGGTVLDLSGADNKSIIGYGYHDGDNQKWTLTLDNSAWTFRNVGTGLYLALDENPQDGVSVVGTSEAFRWDIWPDEQDPSYHRVFVPNTTFNIDLSDHGNPTPGTPIVIWTKWEGTNQTWKFEQGE